MGNDKIVPVGLPLSPPTTTTAAALTAIAGKEIGYIKFGKVRLG